MAAAEEAGSSDENHVDLFAELGIGRGDTQAGSSNKEHVDLPADLGFDKGDAQAGSSDEDHVDLLAELGIGRGSGVQAQERGDDGEDKGSDVSSGIDVRDLIAELGIGTGGQDPHADEDEPNVDVKDLVAELGIGSRDQAHDGEDSAEESSDGDIGDLVADLGIGTRGGAISDSDDEVVAPVPFRKLKREVPEVEYDVRSAVSDSEIKEQDELGVDSQTAALLDLPAAFQTVGLPPEKSGMSTQLENYDTMRWLLGEVVKNRHSSVAGLFSTPVNSVVMGPKHLDLAGAAGAAKSATSATAGKYLRLSADLTSSAADLHWQSCSARTRRAARSLCMLEHLQAMRYDRKQRDEKKMESTEASRWDNISMVLDPGQVALRSSDYGVPGEEHTPSRLVLRPEMRRRAEVQAKPLWSQAGTADVASSRSAPSQERRRMPNSRLSAGLLKPDLQVHRSPVTAASIEEYADVELPDPVATPGPQLASEERALNPAAALDVKRAENAQHGKDDGNNDEQDVDDIVAGIELESSDSDDDQRQHFSNARAVDIDAITSNLESSGVKAAGRSIRDRMADHYSGVPGGDELYLRAEKEKAEKAAQEQAVLAEIRKRREEKEWAALALRDGEFDNLLEQERLKEAEMVNTVPEDQIYDYDEDGRPMLKTEVAPEIAEHVNSYMEERGVVLQDDEFMTATAEVNAARAPQPSRQPDPNPNADWDFDFSGDGRPFRFARGKVARVRAGRGWDDLLFARGQLCGKEFMKFAESGGVLRHDSMRSPFGGLGECGNALCRAHRVFSPHVRAEFRDFIIKWAESPHPVLQQRREKQGFRFVSFGSGELLFETELLERIRSLGIWISQVCLIDKAYQDPSISCRRALREFADWQRATAHLDRKIPAEILVFGHSEDYFETSDRKGRAADCHLFIQCDDCSESSVEECNRLVKRALVSQGMFARLNPKSFLRNTGQIQMPETQSEAEDLTESQHTSEDFSVAVWIQEPTGRLDVLYRLRPLQNELVTNCMAAISQGNKSEDNKLDQEREHALAKQRKEAKFKALAVEDDRKIKEAEERKQNLLQRHREDIQAVQKGAETIRADQADAIATPEAAAAQISEGASPMQAATAVSATAQAIAAVTPSQAPIPANAAGTWESTVDTASGKPYYFNRATGQSSWTPPEGMQPMQLSSEQLEMDKAVKVWEVEEQKFAQYRVVHTPRIIARAEPKSSGKPVGLLYTNEEVLVSPDPHNGWLRVYEGPARAKLPEESWVCWDATADGLGYMLEKVVRKKSAIPTGA